MRLGALLAAAAAAAQTALYVINVYGLDRSIELFDADAEGGLTAWAGTVAIFATALISALLAAAGLPRPRLMLALAAATTLLSLDDAASLHERVARLATDTLATPQEYGRPFWCIVYFPLLTGVAAIVIDLARRNPGTLRLALLCGLTVLAAAVALELASFVLIEFTGIAESHWPLVLEVAIEEAAELAGWILIAAALTGLLLAQAAE